MDDTLLSNVALMQTWLKRARTTFNQTYLKQVCTSLALRFKTLIRLENDEQ